jgi:hypothetical protein
MGAMFFHRRALIFVSEITERILIMFDTDIRCLHRKLLNETWRNKVLSCGLD